MQAFATARQSESYPCTPWGKLLAAIDASVRECAAVAGERLWSCSTCAGSDNNRFRICSAWDARDYAELSFEDGVRIVCRFGPAVSKPELQFHVEGSTLKYGGASLPISAAAAFVLDQLIFPDE